MNVNIGDQFRAQEPWNFGKKNPFIAPQENWLFAFSVMSVTKSRNTSGFGTRDEPELMLTPVPNSETILGAPVQNPEKILDLEVNLKKQQNLVYEKYNIFSIQTPI
jgi:hypothetical protein